MIRTIVALNDDALAENISQALVHRGIAVRYRCRTGAEVLRAVREMDGGVVICAAKLRDITAGELADRLDGQALLLVLVKTSQRALCDREDLFTMNVPVRSSELIGAVTMLLQMDAMRAARTIPKRSDDAQSAIAEAKAQLIANRGMSEPEAHHYLQQRSMQSGVPMEIVARALLADDTNI